MDKQHKNPEIEHLTDLANKGIAQGQIQLAQLYLNGYTKPDHKKAFYWFKKAAEDGFALAQKALGMMYRKGVGTRVNISIGDKWLAMATKNGYEKSDKETRTLFNKMKALGKVDPEKAFNIAKELSYLGCTASQFRLGKMYADGQGTNQIYTSAMYWYKQSAYFGGKDAQYKLGQAYYYGKGASQDNKQACRWLTAASDNNHKDASIMANKVYREDREKYQSNEKQY